MKAHTTICIECLAVVAAFQHLRQVLLFWEKELAAQKTTKDGEGKEKKKRRRTRLERRGRGLRTYLPLLTARQRKQRLKNLMVAIQQAKQQRGNTHTQQCINT